MIEAVEKIAEEDTEEGVRMREIIIHVGFPRTGTTFLQEQIFGKLRNVCLIRSIRFPDWFRCRDKVIISHESLSFRHYDSPAEEKFTVANALKRIFPDAKIIVGIRDAQSWLRSLYSQYIREGGTKTFDEFYKNFDKHHLDFDRYISHLRSLFDQVFVYRFEDFKRDKYRIIKEICDFIDEPVPVIDDIRYRPSLTERQIRAYRLINSLPFPNLVGKVIRYVINFVSHSQPQGEYVKCSKSAGRI